MAAWENYLEQHKIRFLSELVEFLRIPSVSSLSEHAADVERAGEWVAQRLRAAGMEGVCQLPCEGPPVVYGEWLHAPGKPTVLIYGHFDTQPVDPVDLWTNPPFEPVVRGGRVYARGASDDKGNMLIPILAIESMLETEGVLPVNVKVLFEGEEEVGSPHLSAVLEWNRERLACDLAVSADGFQGGEEQPILLLGFKGLCALQVDVEGTNADLHSGVYGGTVQNPIHALARLLDTLRSAQGQVLVEGFYEDVVAATPEERRQIAAVPFDETAYREQLGAGELFGEPGYTTRERAWVRPTLEVNGIWGGFQGEGMKTVIPREAHAKISCRLVADQDPEKTLQQVTTHLHTKAPPGVRVDVHLESAMASAYVMPADHPGNRAAHAVLEELYGCPPYHTRMGGTLPVCGLLLDLLDVHTVTFAFGLEDENAHAPDEFFRLDSFERGQEAYRLLLRRLAQQDGLQS